MANNSDDTITVSVNKIQARELVTQQFDEYIRQLNEAKAAFIEGKFKRAYSIFPYNDPLAENLEEFVKTVKDTNPNL